MPPFNCNKYKQSNPDVDCNCEDCIEEKKAKDEIVKVDRIN